MACFALLPYPYPYPSTTPTPTPTPLLLASLCFALLPYAYPSPTPTPLLLALLCFATLPLPGLDIRPQLNGGVFVFFRSRFGCFHLSVFHLDNLVLVNVGRKKLVLVEFGQEKLFWSRLASKTGI